MRESSASTCSLCLDKEQDENSISFLLKLSQTALEVRMETVKIACPLSGLVSLSADIAAFLWLYNYFFVPNLLLWFLFNAQEAVTDDLQHHRGGKWLFKYELFRGFFSKQADALFTPSCLTADTVHAESTTATPARVGSLSADVTQMFCCHPGS